MGRLKAGALTERDFVTKLEPAGFAEIEVLDRRRVGSTTADRHRRDRPRPVRLLTARRGDDVREPAHSGRDVSGIDVVCSVGLLVVDVEAARLE